MKKLTALLAATVIGAGVQASAQDELSASATFEWSSSYVFRGVKLADETFMPAVDISWGGFYAGIWTALPVTNTADNEIDYYVGYGFPVGELVSLDVGVTHYYYPSVSPDNTEDGTIEAYLGAAFETFLSPAVYVYYDFDLEAWTFEGSIGHSWAISEDLSFDTSAYLGYVEPDEDSGYTYYGVGAGFGYAFTDWASASATLYWAGKEEDWHFDGEEDDNEFWVSVAFSAGF